MAEPKEERRPMMTPLMAEEGDVCAMMGVVFAGEGSERRGEREEDVETGRVGVWRDRGDD